MASKLSSIQSFFDKEAASPKEKRFPTDAVVDCGDGFTGKELDAVQMPTLHEWCPRVKYADTNIGSLIPGPCCVALMGRVVNFYVQPTPSKKPQAAKGCFKLVVKDDTGALMVRLWFAKVNYGLRLGQLVSVWTPHISNSETSSLTVPHTGMVTSIFPERDNSCYFMVQEDSDDGTLCKTPLGYADGEQLAGLMTLKNFVEGGFEVADSKILVCVKSIGGRKKLTDKKGNPIEKVDINVFDDTYCAALTIWNHMIYSVSAWKPSHTILLISNASFREGGKPTLTLNAATQVDIDPQMRDAEWLRGFAQSLTKREHVNQPFPENTFDIETVTTSENRILFTLAEIDKFVRAAPNEMYTGYLSLLISELSITRLHQRSMLCSTEHCGIPLFANSTSAICKQCEAMVQLRLNPRIVGMLLDETGNVAAGKLIWSDTAWTGLFGRTPEELTEAGGAVMKYLEWRLLFLRVTVVFGWSGEVGKLVVLGVRM